MVKDYRITDQVARQAFALGQNVLGFFLVCEHPVEILLCQAH